MFSLRPCAPLVKSGLAWAVSRTRSPCILLGPSVVSLASLADAHCRCAHDIATCQNASRTGKHSCSWWRDSLVRLQSTVGRLFVFFADRVEYHVRTVYCLRHRLKQQIARTLEHVRRTTNSCEEMEVLLEDKFTSMMFPFMLARSAKQHSASKPKQSTGQGKHHVSGLTALRCKYVQ